MTAPRVGSSSVRVGVVGCGYIASLHAEALSATGRASILAVHDADPVAAARFVAAHGGVAEPSHAALLQRAGLDLVLVCTPHDSHLPIVADALRSRARILCEKPLTLTVAEAEAIPPAAERVAVGFNKRFTTGISSLRRRLGSGGARALDIQVVSPPFLDGWAGRPRVGGGVLPGLGSHALDLVRFVLADEITAVQAVASRVRVPADRLADHAVVTARTRRGTIVSIVIHDGGDDAYAMEGGGLLRVRASGPDGVTEATVDACADGGPAAVLDDPPPRVERLGYAAQARELVDWVLQGRRQPRLATLHDGIAVVAAVEAARDSAIEGGALRRPWR